MFARQLSPRTSVNTSAVHPGVFWIQRREWILAFASDYFHADVWLPLPRFADSIRGMLKLILVLMLAGASLASTWFTLTCLSRFTHLPTTAGQYAAGSLVHWWTTIWQRGQSRSRWMEPCGHPLTRRRITSGFVENMSIKQMLYEKIGLRSLIVFHSLLN